MGAAGGTIGVGLGTTFTDIGAAAVIGVSDAAINDLGGRYIQTVQDAAANGIGDADAVALRQ